MITKCCENCEWYKPMEDADIEGICTLDDFSRSRRYWCDRQKPLNNGWTEITPDNESYITDDIINRAVIGWFDNHKRMHIVALVDCVMGIGTMAKTGGYYYYVLPELKIE